LARRGLKWFESTCLIVEVSQIVLHEGGEPNALVDLFDAEFLTGEDLAKVDFPPIEADSPARRACRRVLRPGAIGGRPSPEGFWGSTLLAGEPFERTEDQSILPHEALTDYSLKFCLQLARDRVGWRRR